MADQTDLATCGMLVEKVASFFDARVRSRGESYYYDDRVRLDETTEARSIEATVYGSAAYALSIEVDVGRDASVWTLRVDCSCPYADSYAGFCKHVWATLLSVEDERAHELRELGPAPDRIDVEFQEDGLDDTDDDGWEDEGSWEEETRHVGYHESGLRFLAEPDATSSSPAARRARRKAIIAAASHRASKRGNGDTSPTWERRLKHVPKREYEAHVVAAWDNSPIEPLYVLEVEDSKRCEGVIVSLAEQKITRSGALGKVKRLRLSVADVPRLSTEIDRRIGLFLLGAESLDTATSYYDYYRHESQARESKWIIPQAFQSMLFPLLSESGRFRIRRHDSDELQPVVWDDGPPWEPALSVERSAPNQPYHLVGQLQRGDERKRLDRIDCELGGGTALFVSDGRVHRIEDSQSMAWLMAFVGRESLRFGKSDLPRFLKRLSQHNAIPAIDWPKSWRVETQTDCPPRPKIELRYDESESSWHGKGAEVEVTFLYDGNPVSASASGRFVIDAEAQRIFHRQHDQERRLLQRLLDLGARLDQYREGYTLPQRKLTETIAALIGEGWEVFANRKRYHAPGNFKIDVTTGIDWFDVSGRIDFEEQSAGLPELLAAYRRNEKFVRLGDGSFGMLPDAWVEQHRAWLELGRPVDGRIRFAKTQIGLIDAMLAELPEATFDKELALARKKLVKFVSVKPRSEPVGFCGELRPYQRDGLGWLYFLDAFGWGGCLADDMGLGKTIQILSLLANRQRQRKHGASLVVAPRSVVFNWLRESARFAPKLRLLDYTGPSRKELQSLIPNSDLVLTTYATLRRDIGFLSKQPFNYVILDEAQAIKNPTSQSAKAARLLQARRRVALTGTPVENHLGDLWSILDFLNPGMLGSIKAFRNFTGNAPAQDGNARHLRIIRDTIRPFILRRTKPQVAPELPDRNEQTIECELGAVQAKYYNEIRDHYRASLLGRVEKFGLGRSKMHVLEALLRLRQAACHPGLIDHVKSDAASAKLDTLLKMLDEIIDGGHKALVFSQFTTMLSFVRRALERRGVCYEYLDGRTRNRAARVDRFQSDATCPVFLISLKAGGVGLNLTAAQYVFILDPWWNPAEEAQAIDRTHRIGQNKSVNAYRLIARDTVEEKILQLQRSKRELADAIITEKNSLIGSLTRDELAALLS